MRCVCGFDDDEEVRQAKIQYGRLKCPYCEGEIACEAPTPPGLRTSAEAYAVLAPIVRRRRQETFWAFYVDARNRITGKREICRGSLTTCVVHPREVFGPAIVRRAVALILAHNHPSSGDPTPSSEDIALTNRLVEAGKLMGIPVLDHIIIGAESYFSFRDTGGIPC